jgi:hypothetical protein
VYHPNNTDYWTHQTNYAFKKNKIKFYQAKKIIMIAYLFPLVGFGNSCTEQFLVALLFLLLLLAFETFSVSIRLCSILCCIEMFELDDIVVLWVVDKSSSKVANVKLAS